MKKPEELEKKKPEKKNFWGTMLIISVLIAFLLILIIVNPNGIANSSSDEFDNKDMIIYMVENNITIYGSSTCSYCKKQLNEFEPYQDEAINEGVFVFCDVTQDIGCIDVTSVPAWKKDNKIVHVGYLPLEELKDDIKQN